MNTTYDEDITCNPFFMEFQNEYPDIVRHCILDGWILCVPRIGSLESRVFTSSDFFSHILIPDIELPNSQYFNLNKKPIRVSNGVITTHSNIDLTIKVAILFEETFYKENDMKYKLWCIEMPLYDLNLKNKIPYVVLLTLSDCINFLWSESEGKNIFASIDILIKEFNDKNIDNDIELETLKCDVNSIYEKSRQTVFKNKKIWENSKICKNFMYNINLAIETYILHGIYEKLFNAIGTCMAYDDSNFNKIVRNLLDIQLKHLNISSEYNQSISTAKIHLFQIQNFSTILGKFSCLKNTIESLKKNSSNNRNDFMVIDDLFPILVFLVIKSGVSNWYSHLNFMKHFRFSIDLSNHSDETCYIINNLEAVIEHIKLKLTNKLPLFELMLCDKQLDNHANESNFKQNGNLDELKFLFKQIELSNYDRVKEILKNNSISNKTMPNEKMKKIQLKGSLSVEEILHNDIEDTIELCHPLCVCSKCCNIIYKSSAKTLPNTLSQDSHGFTVLHIACICNESRIVDLILELGADVNVTDHNLSTPLHYAASKGHQNVLLLLLHAGADINAMNIIKNTPLHLASNNGHDSCVKTLVFFAEHTKVNLNLNDENKDGNTPLQLASKWGYENIAQILMKNGANPWKKNSRGKNAVDFAHNNIILKLLCSNNSWLNDYINILNIDKTSIEFIDGYNSKPKIISLESNDDIKNNHKTECYLKEEKKINIVPQITKDIHQIERLFCAIIYGDIKLACFYMGINVEKKIFKESSCTKTHIDYCHPLCICIKCESQDFIKDEHFNINTCDSKGNTALHIAVQYNQHEICKILLKNKANPNIKNKDGLTSLHIAVKKEKSVIVQLLIDYNAKHDIKDNLGNTILHLACISGNVDIVKLILVMGKLTSVNLLGKTPLDEAKDRLFYTIIDLIENLN